MILHNDDNELVYCTDKRLRSARQNVSDYLRSSGTQRRKDMIAMGKVDTSDLMMIIT